MHVFWFDENTNQITGLYSVLLLVTYLWAGMIVGISFLEAPLKFQAPNITLPLGLGIGRLVFSALNKIELFFACLMLVFLLYIKVSSRLVYLYIPILILLLLQSFWLLPVLDERAEVIINGHIPESGSPHIFYVTMEFMKILLLLIFGLNVFQNIVIKNVK